MKKTVYFLIFLILLAGCGRSSDKKAATHVGNPAAVQIVAEGYAPASVSDRGEVKKYVDILKRIEVRPLSVEEELNLVLVQGKTLNATELRFKDAKGNVYKALLLDDGSLLVVEGARGENDKRRAVYLSAPGQQELISLINRHLQK